MDILPLQDYSSLYTIYDTSECSEFQVESLIYGESDIRGLGVVVGRVVSELQIFYVIQRGCEYVSAIMSVVRGLLV